MDKNSSSLARDRMCGYDAKYPNMRFGNSRSHDSRTELADQCDASGAGLNPVRGWCGVLDSIDVGALLAGLAVVGAIPSLVDVGGVEYDGALAVVNG